MLHKQPEDRKICGLVGVAGKITPKEETAFKQLLIVDQLRGKHSVGVAAIDTNGGVEVFKKAVNPEDFFTMQGFKDMMRYQLNVLIGHNRYATQGAVNAVNAHPFEFDTLVGAHNGTLTGQWRLPDHKQFEVDSENIFHAIQKEGLEKTHKNLDGAYALTWWDKENDTLNFIRNDERTFFYTYSEDKLTMFWASESWMLSGILGRNGIKHTKIVSTKPYHHYRFDIPLGFPNKSTPINDIAVRKLEEFVPAYKAPVKKHLIGGKPTYRIGDTIEFRLNLNAVKTQYSVLGHVEGDLMADVEIYNAPDFLKKAYHIGDCCRFVGEISSIRNPSKFNGNKVTELVVKPTTIAKVAGSGNVKKREDETIDFKGVKLNRTEYNNLSWDVRTCAWCDSDVPFEEGNFIDQSKSYGVCKGCYSLEDVKLYLNGDG